MTKHVRFESDTKKAKENLRKHNVSFDDAEVTLADPFFELFHVEEFDLENSERAGEERWVTTGADPRNRRAIYRIVWTPRTDDEGLLTRLISIRTASNRERTKYEKEIRERVKPAN